MDPISITAASGMRSRLESLDMLANNIANTETGGYKVDREFYSLYTAPESQTADGADPSTLPVIEKNYTDFSQGLVRVTSNPLDFAIQGKGFFAVNTPGGVSYTRNGSFQISPTGALVTGEGFAVRDTLGQPLKLDPSLPVEVGPDGSITQSGSAAGQFAVLTFDDPGGLVKQGNTLFRPADPKTPTKPATAEVQQGRLENSNVGSSESAVRLVSVLRQFEMLQKAVNIGAEMNKQFQQVASVGS